MQNLEVLKIDNFIHGQVTDEYRKYFAEAISDIEEYHKGESKFFWRFLQNLNLKVDPTFFKDFKLDEGFQIVDSMGRLTYFSINIAKHLRFDIEHVLETPFEELFERDPFVTKRLMEVFFTAMTAPKKSVVDLATIPKHVVKQIGFPDSSYVVEFKKAYPVYEDSGEFYGFVLRLNVEMLKN